MSWLAGKSEFQSRLGIGSSSSLSRDTLAISTKQIQSEPLSIVWRAFSLNSKILNILGFVGNRPCGICHSYSAPPLYYESSDRQ